MRTPSLLVSKTKRDVTNSVPATVSCLGGSNSSKVICPSPLLSIARRDTGAALISSAERVPS